MNTFYLKIDDKKKQIKSSEITLPKINSSGFCCNGNYNSREDCLIETKLYKVWISRNQKKILIEYGLLAEGDGCDSGPFYMVIDIQETY